MMALLYRLGDALRHRFRLRVWPLEAARGRRGEDLAHRFLRRQGFTVVARNYRLPAGGGEIDLVCREGDALVFVEVKTRASEEFGTPDQAVDHEKEVRLERAARDYARRADVPWARVRFDIVNVVLREPPDVKIIKDAFRRNRTV